MPEWSLTFTALFRLVCFNDALRAVHGSAVRCCRCLHWGLQSPFQSCCTPKIQLLVSSCFWVCDRSTLPPPHHTPSPTPFTLIGLFSFPLVLSHQLESGAPEVQSPTSCSLLCLLCLQLCHHGDWCLGVPASSGMFCLLLAIFTPCFVSPLNSSQCLLSLCADKMHKSVERVRHTVQHKSLDVSA